MKSKRLFATGAAGAAMLAGSVAGAGGASAGVHHKIKAVRAATDRYRDVNNAGPKYKSLLNCMDSRAGGMGQHYVNAKALNNPHERATNPEALVYQVGSAGALKLVAVEYIVPASMVDPANVPHVLGHKLHKANVPGAGELYVLHAWIWKHNPSGMFQDYNPAVPKCPAGSMG